MLHTILSAATELGYSALSEVRFEQPIFADRPRLIQVVADNRAISLASSPAAGTPSDRWTRHVTAQLSSSPSDSASSLNEHHRANGQPPERAHRDLIPDLAELLAMRGIDGLPFSWTVASWTQHSSNLTVAIDLPKLCPKGRLGRSLTPRCTSPRDRTSLIRGSTCRQASSRYRSAMSSPGRVAR